MRIRFTSKSKGDPVPNQKFLTPPLTSRKTQPLLMVSSLKYQDPFSLLNSRSCQEDLTKGLGVRHVFRRRSSVKRGDTPGWFNRPRLNRNVWHIYRTCRLKASKQFKLYGSICKIEPAHLIIDNKGLINKGGPITALSHISIEMQTIIGIISLYDKRQAKNRVDQAIE
jgi:hypothetical protein